MNYIWALLIATIFVAWPMLGRATGANGSWIGTLVMSGTFAATLALSATKVWTTPSPDTTVITKLVVAGLANGWAVWMYARVASHPDTNVVGFVVAVTILMTMVSAVFGWLFFAQPITPKMALGLAMGVLTVWLVNS